MDRRSLVPYGARKTLSSALIDLGTFASRCISRLARVQVDASSEVYLWELVGGHSAVQAVHRLLGAATDHYHAFARLLRLEEPYAPSLAALVRSFGEVMGRAWWLLESKSPEQLVHREAALNLSEHRQAGGQPIGTRGPDGVLTIVEDAVNEAQRRLARVQVAGAKEPVPDYSRLFEKVCDAAGVTDGKELYSHLSGAAHGSSLVIGSLTHIGPQNEDGSAPVALGLSIQLTERYLDALVRITETVVRRLGEAYQAQGELERLHQVVNRVDDTCRFVLVAIERVDPAELG